MLFLVSWDAQAYGRVRWCDWLFEDYRPVTSVAKALNVATRLQIRGVVYGVFHFPRRLGSYLLDKISRNKLVLRISYYTGRVPPRHAIKGKHSSPRSKHGLLCASLSSRSMIGDVPSALQRECMDSAISTKQRLVRASR